MTFESYLNILEILNKDLYDTYTKCATADTDYKYYENSDKIYFKEIYEARISELQKAHPNIKLDNSEIYVNILSYQRAFEVQKAYPHINIIHDDNFEEFCLVGTTYYGCVGYDFARACREMFRDA